MPGRRKTVLIADSSKELVEALTAALEAGGYDVGSALQGEEVFRKMAALDPDALLLDLSMPGLKGADACRLIKAHPHWKRTFLVLMTGRISDAEGELHRHLGADGVLRKPFEPKAAVRAVARGIGAGEPPPF